MQIRHGRPSQVEQRWRGRPGAHLLFHPGPSQGAWLPEGGLQQSLRVEWWGQGPGPPLATQAPGDMGQEKAVQAEHCSACPGGPSRLLTEARISQPRRRSLGGGEAQPGRPSQGGQVGRPGVASCSPERPRPAPVAPGHTPLHQTRPRGSHGQPLRACFLRPPLLSPTGLRSRGSTGRGRWGGDSSARPAPWSEWTAGLLRGQGPGVAVAPSSRTFSYVLPQAEARLPELRARCSLWVQSWWTRGPGSRGQGLA